MGQGCGWEVGAKRTARHCSACSALNGSVECKSAGCTFDEANSICKSCQEVNPDDCSKTPGCTRVADSWGNIMGCESTGPASTGCTGLGTPSSCADQGCAWSAYAPKCIACADVEPYSCADHGCATVSEHLYGDCGACPDRTEKECLSALGCKLGKDGKCRSTKGCEG
eukprot:Hpha_TRINITY_DN1006_c0_g2::TRINITY_DN1006_c0_g2_i1::g.84717::m.84717